MRKTSTYARKRRATSAWDRGRHQHVNLVKEALIVAGIREDVERLRTGASLHAYTGANAQALANLAGRLVYVTCHAARLHGLGESPEAHLNVAWNYARHYYRVFTPAPLRPGVDQYHANEGGTVGGIRSIYGLTGAESIPVLQHAIDQLGDDTHPDYWEPTEGKAKRALTQLLALAKMRPDGVWNGD